MVSLCYYLETIEQEPLCEDLTGPGLSLKTKALFTLGARALVPEHWYPSTILAGH